VDVAERLERQEGLDAPAQMITRVIRRIIKPGVVKDTLHGVPSGHPVHAPLTDVPVGAWTSAAVLDLLPGTERASRILIAAGLAGAVPTVLTGWTDWSALHREQQRVGLVHALGTGTAAALYSFSLLARIRGRQGVGKALSFAGLGALLTGAFLGGHLAFRLAAGANHAESVTHLVSLGWHDLCQLSDLPDGWPVHRRLGYIGLFVLRTGDEVSVLTDRCAHLGGPLHQGRLIDSHGEICVVCPWHGSTFRVEDGGVVHGPSTAPQPAFATRVSDDGIVQVRPVG
jgi:nitrite reductase/ring-hydroxylating ferredoxin subunit/uncharacterized membrane protein